MKKQFVIFCLDINKYYLGRLVYMIWVSDVRSAKMFDSEDEADQEFIDAKNTLEDYDIKFKRDLPDNPIFEIPHIYH